jgi:hypothetical protein
MRRDARVCPHCRDESEPGSIASTAGGSRDRERGTWLWLDEDRDEWIAQYHATPPAAL